MAEFYVESDRLILREWRDSDIAPFHAICSDPEVMATLGPLMTITEVEALVARMRELQRQLGHCFWTVEEKASGDLIGWCGVIRGREGTPIHSLPEIGWRLARAKWGVGFASEAARVAVKWSFENLPDDSVWAITSKQNMRSRAVMERLGMKYQTDLDFDRLTIAPDSDLYEHVTYRISRPDWNENA